MRALSSRQRDFFYKWFVLGSGRRIAKPLYEQLLNALILIHRLSDSFVPRENVDLSDLTLIIKTFNRPLALTRLVASIRRLYPTVAVIVADDGQKSAKLDEVYLLRLPFDVGISAGRNRALDHVKTKYFLLLDDDFLFSRRQRLGELVTYMNSHAEVDIAGGRYVDLPLYIEHRFDEQPVHATDAAPVLPLGTVLGHGVVVDKVQNYFIGRTESVKKVGWNEAYKLQEHTEFFTRARGQLVTVFHRKMRILHVKYPFDLDYLVYRYRRPVWQVDDAQGTQGSEATRSGPEVGVRLRAPE